MTITPCVTTDPQGVIVILRVGSLVTHGVIVILRVGSLVTHGVIVILRVG
jgi:hypothetical protein